MRERPRVRALLLLLLLLLLLYSSACVCSTLTTQRCATCAHAACVQEVGMPSRSVWQALAKGLTKLVTAATHPPTPTHPRPCSPPPPPQDP